MHSNQIDTQPIQKRLQNKMLNSESSEDNKDLFSEQSIAQRFFFTKKFNRVTPHQNEEEEYEKDIYLEPTPHLVNTDREKISFIPIYPNSLNQLEQNLFQSKKNSKQHSRIESRQYKIENNNVPSKRGIYSNLIQHFLLKTFVKKLSFKRYMNSQFNQYHFNAINDKGSVLKDKGLSFKPILEYDTSNHRAQIVIKQISNWLTLIYKKIKIFIKRVPIFYPESVYKLILDGFVQIARVYFIFVIPFDLSFQQQQFMFGPLYSTTVVMLSLLIVDFVVSFNTAHYMQGQIVINRLQIAKHVVSKSGGLEIASVIFLVMIWSIVEIDNFYKVDAETQLYQLGLLIFFIQCRNISKFIRQVEEALNLSKPTKAILELLRLIAAVIVVLHIFACIWYWAGSYSNVQYGKSWLDTRGLVGTSWQDDYLYAFYFSTVTMFTVGYGDITPQNNLEVIISICFMMITSIQLSYSVSTVGAIIDKISTYEDENLKRLQIINNFMQSKKIGYELQYQIREYLNYFWQAQNEEDIQQEKTIINQLSENLRLRLMLEANSLILNNCILFRNHFSAQLKIKLVKCIRQVVVQPENIIDFDSLIPNHQQNQIYLCFIERGSIEILIENEGSSVTNLNHSDESIVSQLNEGECLGYFSFITGKKSTERYRSIGFTKLLLLNRDDFLKIITDFPEDKEQYQYFQDQIKLYQNSDFLKLHCFSCHSPNHKAVDCPFLHFIPDREFLIKQVQFSRLQNRNESQSSELVYQRKSNKAKMNARQNKDFLQETAVYLQNDYWQEILFFDCDYEKLKPNKKEMRRKSTFYTRQQTHSLQETNIQDDDLNNQYNQNSKLDMMQKSSMKMKNEIVQVKLQDSKNVVKQMSPLSKFNMPTKDDKVEYCSLQNIPQSSKFRAKRANTLIIPLDFSQMKFPSIESNFATDNQDNISQKFQMVIRRENSLKIISQKRPIQKNRVINEVGILEQESASKFTFERNQLNNLMYRRKHFTDNGRLSNTSPTYRRDCQTAEFTILKLQMLTDLKAPISNFEVTKTFKFYFPHNNLESVLQKQEIYYKPNQKSIQNLPQIYSKLVQYMMYPYQYIDKYKFHSMDKNKEDLLPLSLKLPTTNSVTSPLNRLVIKQISQNSRQKQARPVSDRAIPTSKSKNSYFKKIKNTVTHDH